MITSQKENKMLIPCLKNRNNLRYNIDYVLAFIFESKSIWHYLIKMNSTNLFLQNFLHRSNLTSVQRPINNAIVRTWNDLWIYTQGMDTKLYKHHTTNVKINSE